MKQTIVDLFFGLVCLVIFCTFLIGAAVTHCGAILIGQLKGKKHE